MRLCRGFRSFASVGNAAPGLHKPPMFGPFCADVRLMIRMGQRSFRSSSFNTAPLWLAVSTSVILWPAQDMGFSCLIATVPYNPDSADDQALAAGLDGSCRVITRARACRQMKT